MTVRTLRGGSFRVRLPYLPHLGQGALLGAQWIVRTTGVGAPVPMLASLGERLLLRTSIPRTQALSFKAKSS